MENIRTLEYDKYGKKLYDSFLISEKFFNMEMRRHEWEGDNIRTRGNQTTVRHPDGSCTIYRRKFNS